MKKLIIFFISCILCTLSFSVAAVGNCELQAKGVVCGLTEDTLSSNSVTLTLTEEYSFTGVEVGDDITSWFRNIPTHEDSYFITASVSNFNNNIMVVEFAGMYDEDYSANVEVTVPKENIVGSNVENDISNVPSQECFYLISSGEALAYYPDSYIVSGYVGEELVTYIVQIQLDGTEPLFNDEDYPLYSDTTYISSLAGLSFTTEYNPVESILTITYSGQPEVECQELIHTTFTPELITSITEDLAVPDRIDVKFDIKVRELEEEIEEEQEPEEDDDEEEVEQEESKATYVLPKTGIK